MASYAIYVTDDGSSNFGVVAFNAPATLPAGGTRLSIPWITNANAGSSPVVISAATTATPIAITTAAAHGLVTGDTVQVYLNSATPAVENIVGTYQFTKTAATTGTLDGSVGSGTYTASTASIKKLATAKEVATAIQAGLRSVLDDRASGN